MLEHDHHGTDSLMRPPAELDYSLTGKNFNRAIELGLAEADWYQSPVPRATLRKLLERKNGPAIRDTLLLVTVLAATGFATAFWWGNWWAVIPYFIYATFYGTSSDSRWHECGHGTAFRTNWMNNVVYEVASFMVMRESVVWRWSHTRHHSDTIIVGRDPEIQVPRPADIKGLLLSVFNFSGYKTFIPKLLRHSVGKISDDEKTFIPESEFSKVFACSRVYLGLYVLFIVTAIVTQSWLPIFLFVLPQFFGTWLMILQNTPQHAGLAENVLDHRLNCRTVFMNPISRFIYWNMNYHVEHHMYPLVPYHALPKLHEVVKADCPPPYPSIMSAWREIWPTVLKQVKDPNYHVKRTLPPPQILNPEGHYRTELESAADGWLEICAAADLTTEEVIRFDYKQKTFALIRDAAGDLFATDGICTHGNTHLAGGLVKGKIVECPKHNGRFNFADGSPARAPICSGLAIYPLEDRDGRLWINVEKAGGVGARPQRSYQMRVVSNQNVSTFIKELVLELIDSEKRVVFTPGDYLQLDIPIYDEICFTDFDIPEPYAEVWQRHTLFDLTVKNPKQVRRNNYSIASNQATERTLRFNVRIATPPPGQTCSPGVGSSYVFSLKAGDLVTATGPFGDFHLKPTQKEMLYIGGGAGMAPLRAHLSHLLETENSHRKIGYWYGARSKQEIYYQEYFETLVSGHSNFSFELALSDPTEEDAWLGHHGFIHEVVLINYLEKHPNPKGIEYYLCGPPMMIKACTKMLKTLGVPADQISFDEF